MGSVAVIVIIIAGAVFTAAVVYMVAQRRTASAPTSQQAAALRLPASLSEFHIRGEEAHVAFDVPLPEGDSDPVLGELLIREAIEVVRENRHHLPIGEVHRVVAFGRRGGAEVWVGAVDLDTPGELPPPVALELLPKLQAAGFDPFEVLSDLQNAPGLAEEAAGGELAPLANELRLAANVEVGLRTQGVDPAAAGAGDVVIGVMRLTGYTIEDRGDETYRVARAGETTFVRVVPHVVGDHPELGEGEIRRFAVEFAESGADRGLLVSEKYSPFEIYERERREPRIRFVTRERLQHFVDALALR